jgi:predicted metal-binding protein
MCPPDVGDIDDMIERARKHRRAFVFQSVAPLEDSFDAGGMREAAKKHLRLLQLIFSKIPVSWGLALKLGAGGCSVCDAPCAKSDGEPCRHPEKAIASMESYGIAVYELAERCGLQYVNGENTVTYFGAILYD